MIIFPEQLKQEMTPHQPLFEQMMHWQGELFREQPGRMTQRIRIGEKTYFIKQHFGIGWREIFKNWARLTLPVCGAKNEWRALKILQQAGLGVPEPIAYGRRGLNLAAQESFVVMSEITDNQDLESLTESWRQQPPSFTQKYQLIVAVARFVRHMHELGINHRDCYLCHFLWQSEQKKLYLIDWHRAQKRSRVPVRWAIKDISGLYFSSKDCGLTKRDLFRFLKIYFNQSLRVILREKRRFLRRMILRGEKLYREHHAHFKY